MRAILGCGLAVVLALTAAATADEKGGKIDAKKLVGKWEPKKLSKELPKGVDATLEFTKDGKAMFAMKGMGKEFKMAGTYKLVGDQLTTTMDQGGKEKVETATVTKLTADEFEVKDEKGEVDLFKRTKSAK